MKKIISGLISVFLLIPILVLGQVPGLPPKDARSQVPEKDWVQLYCFEAKARGGEAIAKLEAMAEILPPIIEQLQDYGIQVDEPDYQTLADDFESKLDEICGQTLLEATMDKVGQLMLFAYLLRDTLGENLRIQIEPVLELKSKAFKAKINKKFIQEIDSRIKEIELKLQIQADKEKKKLEMKVKKNFIRESELVKLREKYKKLAKLEEEKLKNEFERKVEKFGGEEKITLQSIRNSFQNFNSRLEKVFQTKIIGWLEFREKAAEKKKQILKAIIRPQIEDRIAFINNHREELDNAKARGEDIPAADELINQLRANFVSMVGSLAGWNLTFKNIKSAGTELSLKSDFVRLDVENAKLGRANLYQLLKNKLEIFGFNENMLKKAETKLVKFDKFSKLYSAWLRLCEISDDKKLCGDLLFNQGINSNTFAADLKDAKRREVKLANTFKEFLTLSKNSKTDAIKAYKAQLVDALTEYKLSANEFAKKYGGGEVVFKLIKAAFKKLENKTLR